MDRSSESFASSIDPRAKIIGAFILIVVATFIHSLLPLLALLVFSLGIALASRVRIRHMTGVWLGVPLFSLAIILPAITNLVTDGQSVITLWHFGKGISIGYWHLPEYLTVTKEGLYVASRFLVRTIDCVLLVFLLVATTGPTLLVSSFRSLGVPKVFGMVMSMTQRYLSITLRAGAEIHMAKLSRSITLGSVSREQAWVAAAIGSLFRKSKWMAECVYDAMISRGYDGDIQVRRTPGFGIIEVACIALCVAVSVLLIVADRFY